MRLLPILVSAFCLSLPASAEVVKEGWSGEGSFSASNSTGNTETTDLGVGLHMTYKNGRWISVIDAQADYGETDGDETENRSYLAGTIDYQLADRLFAFGKTSYERDEFSGFESRLFVGGGLGWKIFDTDALTWSVRGGPGFKIDETRASIEDGVIVEEAETVESLSVIGNSQFDYAFNDNVSLSNATSILYAEESTQFSNTIALTAALTNSLSGRLSYEWRHDTEPPEGYENTDTTTRVSIVYKFGG